jgi:hypothetical protein
VLMMGVLLMMGRVVVVVFVMSLLRCLLSLTCLEFSHPQLKCKILNMK